MKKAILLLNGSPQIKNFPKNTDEFFIACADGAYNWAKECKVTPNIILGDMDSTKIYGDDIESIVFPSIKNMTDGEISLDYLIDEGYDDIYIFGAVGKRDDHYLANIFLLYRALKRGAKATIVGDYTTFFAADNQVILNNLKNRTISVAPLTDELHIISSEGLMYEIDDLTFTKCISRGISNVAIEDTVRLNIDRGVALIYIVHQVD